MSEGAREKLLGFDAREMWRETGSLLHPSHSRSTFLLREDVKKVFSADVLVWPSVFDGAGRPAWIGANPPFWEDLEQFEERLPGGAPFLRIAATWHIEPASEEEARARTGPHDAPARPQTRDPAWKLLGFDVCDGSFLSGLSDCGYTPRERIELAPRWGPRLDEHHLFTRLADAFEFRALTDRRVAEHAPFFVIGLWKIPGQSATMPSDAKETPA
ncbi:MAG TPA: hypothetical protein VL285_05015 [Bryobacteraceae bacterium]|nr:hypothetical protein [Bryobacteraceae bacterium]